MDELASIVTDLQPTPWPGGSPTEARDVGVLASFARSGRWAVAAEYHATAVIGSGVTDLRQAQFTAPEATIHVNSWIAAVCVLVVRYLPRPGSAAAKGASRRRADPPPTESGR